MNSLNATIKAHLAILFATIIFAVNYWISKDLVAVFSVPQLVFLRTVGATVLFGLVFAFRPVEKVALKDKAYLALAALFGIALSQILFFAGLHFTTPLETATIHLSNPIMVLLLSMVFLHAKLDKIQVVGVTLGAIGALILVLYQKDFQWTGASIIGNAMILGNTFAYATFLVMMKPILKKYSPLTTSFWLYLSGTILIIPLSIKSVLNIETLQTISLHALSILYLIVLVTFLAYFLSIYSLHSLSPTVVSYYIYLQPVLAFIIAIFLGEQLPELVKIAAAFIIVAGVYLVNKKKKDPTDLQLPLD
jgi:drug/metabolite transporter (DMT)-like permease